MTYDEFLELKPITNPLVDGTMFETYGPEVDFVFRFSDPLHVWTLMDDAKTLVCGRHIINRLGYFITALPGPKLGEEICITDD